MGSDSCHDKHDSVTPKSSALPSGQEGQSTVKEDPVSSGSCCEGSCSCDEQCLSQLARAICADDDDHIHSLTHKSAESEEKAPGGNTSQDDSCSCCDTESTHRGSLFKYTESAEQDLDATQPGVGPRILPSTACGEHMTVAKTRQKDALTTFGCLCKALLARGRQSCCSTKPERARVVSLTAKSLRTSIKARKSTDTCCSSSSCGRPVHSLRKRTTPSISSSCGNSCCVGEKTSVVEADRQSVGGNSCCDDSCCGKSVKGSDVDLEKQSLNIAELSPEDSSSPLAHAVLAVKGMTCTGCENKLIRTLRAIPTICNVKTSLVLSRAEFDYRGDADDLSKLIGTIEKRTGFSAEQVADNSVRGLELNVDPKNLDQAISLSYPEGVAHVIRVDQRTIRVIHDPHIFGSRDVIAHYSKFSPTLAPEPRDPALTAGLKHIRNLAIRTIASALLTIPVLVMTWAPLPKHPTAYAIASLVLASIVQTVIAGPFYAAAFKSLFFSRIIETDLLIVLSTTTAYIYSVVAFAFDIRGHPLTTGEFFETSTLLVTLIMLGQLISAFARQRAVEAISLRSLQQTNVTLVDSDGKLEVIDVRLLQYGDTFLVAPDSSIITDGIVILGQSEVDESMMTGEFLPVEKKVGSTVIAGTNNGSGTLKIRVTRLPGENTISDIADMVDDARFSRARIQATVDLVCGWFVPVVLVVAILTFIIWVAVGIKVKKQSHGQAVVSAITYAIAVLAISCPCAIGLAVPMVILIASGVAANKLGLIFKSAVTIESAKKINHVVFDKTGTLTMGKLAVIEAQFPEVPGIPFDVRAAILGLVTSNNHPVSRSIAEFFTSRKVEPIEVQKVEMVTGKGVQGYISDELLRGGNPKWLNVETDSVVVRFLESGYSVFCITFKSHLIGVFALQDTVRPEASAVISCLRARDIQVSILSGDHQLAVEHVAQSLGIPPQNIRSGCLPADKQEYIRMLTKDGQKVLFCGDGTNDAVALAQADIGVHMQSSGLSTSSGVAASTAADVVLIHPTLTGILALLELSEAVNKRIVANFVWSAVYNLVAALFAAGAFVNVRIAPAYAGLGEVVSVVPVVLVALQLKWFKSRV